MVGQTVIPQAPSPLTYTSKQTLKESIRWTSYGTNGHHDEDNKQKQAAVIQQGQRMDLTENH
jgi:queuine/archaeosine tRNA-ribosyltransferase